MAYQTAKTIKEIIDNIKNKHYVLPSIQREFVWKLDQIETFFDSLMRDYPIGTFLFWQVDKTKVGDFRFYDFLKDYHEKNNQYNQKASITEGQGITAVLDGQQRMTSIYMALAGSYANRKPYARNDDDTAYPTKHLYLNLLKESDELEVTYDFRFLTKEETEHKKDGFYWFDCRKILSFEDKTEIYDYLDDKDLSDTHKLGKETVKFARNTLNRFYDAIYINEKISFYLEKSEELDRVLQIFIRINSGGTKLNSSDLLLSMATAQWKNKDAREVIRKFVDSINQIGNGFTFNKDIVLKNCLVLAEFKDTRFKTSNFNKENMEIIQRDWEKTSLSFKRAIELVFQFGYNEKSLTAKNAIIPISYFIYKNECADKILSHSEHENNRKAIKEWLARVLLKGVFGAQTDSIFPPMQKLININNGYFPLQEIIEFYKGKSKSISFSNDEIDNLLDLQYKNPRTYCALSLIYPEMNSSFRFHKDHIHPRSKFSKKEMKDAGVPDEQIAQFNAEMNGIANLQLLESTANIEKKDKPFKEWLDTTYPNQEGKERYLMLNHIDSSQFLEFKDFLGFIAERKKIIKGVLSSVLGITAEDGENA